MSNNYKKWTLEEDSILIAQVKANPQNLQLAFFLTSTRVHRSKNACSNRWYQVLSKNNANTNNICFTIFSKSMYGINRKNLKTPCKENKNIWNYIINFIKKL